MEQFLLWENQDVTIDFYKSDSKSCDSTVVIFPGGGYAGRATHEGHDYAVFFNEIGVNSFVVNYRVNPDHFPLQLLDARRAVRFVRYHAEKFGVNKKKIAVMGSSAGGHLAALLSNYNQKIDGEGIDATDDQDYLPNWQILCYPVISSNDEFFHRASFVYLLGDRYNEKEKFSTELLVNPSTPPAFIWHTVNDSCVPVRNSLEYSLALTRNNIPHELHIFPYGSHGLGLAKYDNHVCQWVPLLKNWLKLNGFFDN